MFHFMCFMFHCISGVAEHVASKSFSCSKCSTCDMLLFRDSMRTRSVGRRVQWILCHRSRQLGCDVRLQLDGCYGRGRGSSFPSYFCFTRCGFYFIIAKVVVNVGLEIFPGFTWPAIRRMSTSTPWTRMSRSSTASTSSSTRMSRRLS